MRLRFVHRPPAAFNTAWRRPNLSLCVCIAFAVCLAHPVSTQDHRLGESAKNPGLRASRDTFWPTKCPFFSPPYCYVYVNGTDVY